MNQVKHLPAFIARQADRLEMVKIESAPAEIEWMLCHVLDINRLDLYLHGERLFDTEAQLRFEAIMVRRLTREPLQYILGESWFYGRKFSVTPAVMVPTPETEGLCEAALRFITKNKITHPRILDVGTGSGVIAVTMAAECPQAEILAVDLATDALSVAIGNANNLEVSSQIEFRESNFLSAIDSDEQFDLILSNPPYIREGDYDDLPPEVLADPKLAMTSGSDGLDAIRAILAAAPDFLRPGGWLMFEIGMGQAEAIAQLTASNPCYRELTIQKDLNDIDRICMLDCGE